MMRHRTLQPIRRIDVSVHVQRHACIAINGKEKMKRKSLRFGKGFRVALGNRRVQAAEMVIEPGESEGGPRNRHRGADQWLFVVDGQGVAVVNRRRHAIKAGSLLLIEHGEKHEIRNTGRTPLKTLNFYSPPAYTPDGNALPRAKP
jgi:mannose-6-phosphate isomerase-like protein (cupin superfamily)